MTAHSETTTRVLLVEAEEAEATRLSHALGGRGIAVTSVPSVPLATSALRAGGFDAVVLSQPREGSDLVASCATLLDGPEPPPLLLLDGTNQAADAAHLLPERMRPASVLPHPVDPGKLALEIDDILSRPETGEGGSPHRSLPEILVQLRDRRETGTLEIRADGVCTTLYLRDGATVLAEGGSLRETLGRLLLRHGKITERDYVRVIERMTERLVDNEPLRMGEVLIELGLLEPAGVYEALQQQLREKIVGCFQWTRFTHVFHAMEALPEGLGTFQTPHLEALILEGVKTHYGPGRVELLLRSHAHRYPLPPADPTGLAERFGMDGQEHRLLREMDGTRTLAALRRESRLGAQRAGQILAALVVTGEIGFADAPERPAPARPVARPARERGARPRVETPAPRKPRVEKSAVAEPPHDEARTRLGAESAFRKGQALLGAEKFDLAHQAFAAAQRLQPGEPEYAMYEAWSAYLSKRTDLVLARARARAFAVRVAQLDPQTARPHTILGRLALDDQKFDAAAREFEAALVRDPEDREAQQGLRALVSSGRRS